MDSLSIVIPVLNEREVFDAVLKEVRDFADRFDGPVEIIIADGGSTDGTETISRKAADADARIHYIRVESSRSFGDSVRAGLRTATGDMVALLDSDGQSVPFDLLRLTSRLRGGLDLVQGRRCDRHDSLIRKAISRCFNIILFLLHGNPFHDTNCTIKVFRREAFLPDIIEGRASMISTQIMAHAKKHDLRVAEEPVSHRAREGASRIFGGLNLLKQSAKVFRESLRL